MFHPFHRRTDPALEAVEPKLDGAQMPAGEGDKDGHGQRPDLDAAPPPRPREERPALGLALGGGAARGFAHIGILRVLEKNGILPRVVTGTSIGAVVGGVWAAGKLDALEEWALSLTKRRVLGMLDFALGGAGLIGGRRLVDMMRDKVGDIAIEDLPLVFGAIATELGTGHEIWLTRGDFVEALRASYALPGIFTPVNVGGRWLMDGALVNPVPVSPARALGARLVMAVNLNSDVFGRGTVVHDHGGIVGHVADAAITGKRRTLMARLSPDRLRRHFFSSPADDGPRGLSTVMIDAFNITQDRIARSRLAGDPPDLTIAPKLATIGLFDFQRARETIAAGAEAAERSLGDIMAAVESLK